ncbi:MAG: hypothetical protein KGL39_24095 [Patescibacteria group bacterium]|nr:hypothetical protein [Patescibacteria group bacterium]
MTDAELAWMEAVTELLSLRAPVEMDDLVAFDRVRDRLADIRREREREIEETGR